MFDEIPASRLERLRGLVRVHGVVSLRMAREALGVSEMTVRRDFAALEEQGVVRRTRGGVIAVDQVVPDTPYVERQVRATQAKSAIARRAATVIEDGDTIFLSGGTTCLELARALGAHRELTVITNSERAVPVLAANPCVTVIASGGQVDRLNHDMSGPVAESTLAEMRARKAFIGATGINEDGVFNSNLGRASVDRLMVRGAAEVFVLADRTKIAATALAMVCPLSEVRAVVTDLPAGSQDETWLTEAGVEVVRVGEPDVSLARKGNEERDGRG